MDTKGIVLVIDKQAYQLADPVVNLEHDPAVFGQAEDELGLRAEWVAEIMDIKGRYELQFQAGTVSDVFKEAAAPAHVECAGSKGIDLPDQIEILR